MFFTSEAVYQEILIKFAGNTFIGPYFVRLTFGDTIPEDDIPCHTKAGEHNIRLVT